MEQFDKKYRNGLLCLIPIVFITAGAVWWYLKYAPPDSYIAKTKLIEFYEITGDLPCDYLEGRASVPSKFTLAPKPFLSDADFVGWNMTNNTFYVTTNAGLREHWSGSNACGVGMPYALLVKGQPVYIGEFEFAGSSAMCVMPTMCPTVSDIEGTSAFRIQRGYPSDGFGQGPDLRNDPRLVEAVQELFANRKQTNK
jgi:hypothetical protein